MPPMVFCTTLTLYMLARFGKAERRIDLVACGASLGLAFLSKEISIILLGAVYAFLAVSPEIRVRPRDIVLSVAAMIIVMLIGFPVAFSLAGTSLIFALFGWLTGSFDPSNFGALASRYVGFMTNEVLIAVPLFIFMGVILERSGKLLSEHAHISKQRQKGSSERRNGHIFCPGGKRKRYACEFQSCIIGDDVAV